MSAVVFVGPTLRREDFAHGCGFSRLAPAAQGDIYRAALRRPRAIGIVDGYFSQAPAIWHKEILWTMAQGIYVFGSASMGALRAAELHAFGMRGVGRIFADFRDGVFEDDDEVAVEHGPAELSFVAVSEPMVNIRATLARAVSDGVVGGPTANALANLAKSLFFPKRNWSTLLDAEATPGIVAAEVAALKAWLPTGAVDQKRTDALEMLAAMRETLAAPAPFHAEFQFERTYLWEEFVAGSAASEAADGLTQAEQEVLDELRLRGPREYAATRRRALSRLAATRQRTSDRFSAAEPTPRDLRDALAELRKTFSLAGKADLDRWITDNDLDEAGLARLLRTEWKFESFRQCAASQLDCALADELRMSGAYRQLAARARQKQAALKDSGGPAQAFGHGLHDTALRAWFFEQHASGGAPDSAKRVAHDLGFADVAAFDAALRRERLFQQITGVRWNT